VRGVEVTESDGLGRGVGPKDRALLPTVKIIMKEGQVTVNIRVDETPQIAHYMSQIHPGYYPRKKAASKCSIQRLHVDGRQCHPRDGPAC